MLTDNILDLIGNTPLIALKGERIFAKAEFLNPGGSVKDRVALAMLEGAERDGRLNTCILHCRADFGEHGHRHRPGRSTERSQGEDRNA